MLLAGLLASVELGLNRCCASTARPCRGWRIWRQGDCRRLPQPGPAVFILPSDEGLMLAAHWETEVDCTLRAPASSLLQLALSKDKTAVLHSPRSSWTATARAAGPGGVLQDLELDWEYELRAGSARSPRNCSAVTCAAARAGPARVRQPQPEPRRIPGRRIAHPGRQREAEARFSELDQIKSI
jgi:ubiquinone biosynthesis protein UbiJ